MYITFNFFSLITYYPYLITIISASGHSKANFQSDATEVLPKNLEEKSKVDKTIGDYFSTTFL